MADNNYDPNMYRFESLGEFKYCVSSGAEVVFEFRKHDYGIFPMDYRSDGGRDILFTQCNIPNSEETEINCKDVDELLEVKIDGCSIRDIILTDEVEIYDRTL